MKDAQKATLFRPGNKAGLRHGGETGIKRLAAGEKFPAHSPAHEAQLDVFNDIESHGLKSFLESRAVQVEALCDLFWSEIVKAAEAGDVELLDKRVKRWGWLRGVADRSWRGVLEMRSANEDEIVLDAIAAAKDATDEQIATVDPPMANDGTGGVGGA